MATSRFVAVLVWLLAACISAAVCQTPCQQHVTSIAEQELP